MSKRTKPTERRYVLTLTYQQAEIIQEAVELVARLGVGQWRQSTEFLPQKPFKDMDWGAWHSDLDIIGKMLSRHTEGGVDGWTSSLGINNPKLSDTAQNAWDLYQVIRRRLSWDRAIDNGEVKSHDDNRNRKTMMGACYDEPMKAGKEPLAVIEAAK